MSIKTWTLGSPKTQFAVRNLIALGLLWGVYGETGPFTTLVLFILLSGDEVRRWL